MMKKYILLSILGILISFTSCFDGAFEIYPTDQITGEKVFGSEDAAEAALIGVYSRFSPGWYKYYVIEVEVYGNKDFNPGEKQGGLYALYTTHKLTSASVSFKSYKRLWAVIIYANNFLKNIDRTSFKDPVRKEQAIAEARFLRALEYFYIVQLWGPVPLITETENYGEMYPPNSTEDDIYAQIIEDLDYAVDHLPVTAYKDEHARATKGAAQGILAKVLMTAPGNLKDIQKGVELCEDVMNDQQYSLLPDFDDLWDKQNTYNSEQIFTAALSDQGSANGIDFSVYASHDYNPTKRFYNSFDKDSIVGSVSYTDERRKATVYYNRISRQLYDNKYRRAGKGTSPNHSNPNLYVLRLADIILLRAEGLNKLDYDANKDKIVDLINIVRNRAGAVPTTLDECNSREATALVIEEERHKELFFEFQEFFDLKRNNRLIDVLGKNGAGLGLDEEYQTLWPIPESEINKNENLMQNPGY